jgi:hypothetical protein
MFLGLGMLTLCEKRALKIGSRPFSQEPWGSGYLEGGLEEGAQAWGGYVLPLFSTSQGTSATGSSIGHRMLSYCQMTVR